MSQIRAYLASFWRRYRWFYLPILLLFLVPGARDSLRLQLWNSSIGQNWRGSLFAGRFDPSERWYLSEVAQKHPKSLAVGVRRIWEIKTGQRAEDVFQNGGGATDFVGDQNLETPGKLAAELQKRFPEAKWLGSLRLRCLVGSLGAWAFVGTTLEKRRVARWDALAARQCQIEPDNAFPLVCRARFLMSMGFDDAAWGKLQLAAQKPFYDDHQMDIQRALLASYELVRPLTAEEKLWILARQSALGHESLGFLTNDATSAVLAMRQKSQNARAVRLIAALAQIGDLMQRNRNTASNAKTGAAIQRMAFDLAPGLPIRRKSGVLSYLTGAGAFGTYAKRFGRPDLARKARQWNNRSYAVQHALNGRHSHEGSDLGGDAAWYLEWVRWCGSLLQFQAIWLWMVWLLAAMALFRPPGAQSSRRDRTVVAAGAILVSLLLAGVVLGWAWLDLTRKNGQWRQDNVFGALAVVAFFAPPFGMALAVSVLTFRRFRAAFQTPARLEVEMGLPPFSRCLLRLFLPVAFGATLAGLLLSFGVWAWANWVNLAPFNALAFLPSDAEGVQPTWQWRLTEPTGLFYCLFLALLGFVFWFLKWRWGTAPHARPVTLNALRWWKESLGAYLIALAWAFLLVMLVAWPLRRRAENRVEALLTRGEIAVLMEEK